jgi:hypothetical protein
MELAGLEPATSWVRCGKALSTECADLLGVSRDSVLLSDLVRRSACRHFSGAWSTQPAAWTSGGATAEVAPLSSERDRSEEVSSRS